MNFDRNYMTASLSSIPSGLRYYFGAEAKRRREIENIAMSVFASFGYDEITTPTIDYFALFELGMGSDEAGRAFRFADSDGNLLALRPDITSSIARASVTLFADSARPLRFCYTASVFRRDEQSRAQKARETKQIGCELIGENSPSSDVEILKIVTAIFQKMNLKIKFLFTVSSSEVFNGIAENLNLSDTEKQDLHALVNVRDSAEVEKFLLEKNAPKSECEAFARLIQLTGNRMIFEEARKCITNSRSVVALEKLEILWQLIEKEGFDGNCLIDLGEVSGMDYYTDLTFKIYAEGIGKPIGSGGRYDKLTENFGKTEPAIGFVLFLESLTEIAC